MKKASVFLALGMLSMAAYAQPAPKMVQVEVDVYAIAPAKPGALVEASKLGVAHSRAEVRAKLAQLGTDAYTVRERDVLVSGKPVNLVSRGVWQQKLRNTPMKVATRIQATAEGDKVFVALRTSIEQGAAAGLSKDAVQWQGSGMLRARDAVFFWGTVPRSAGPVFYVETVSAHSMPSVVAASGHAVR